MSKKTLYVVVERGYEYNDEINVLGRGEDTLTHAYEDKEKADLACQIANVKRAQELNTNGSYDTFSYDMPEDFSFVNMAPADIMKKLRAWDMIFYRVETVTLG